MTSRPTRPRSRSVAARPAAPTTSSSACSPRPAASTRASTKNGYVAYSGGGELKTALLAGDVGVGISSVSEFKDLIAAGTLRALAVSAAKPATVGTATVPTIKESGYDVELMNWRGLVAAPGISDGERTAIIKLVDDLHKSSQWQATPDPAGLGGLLQERRRGEGLLRQREHQGRRRFWQQSDWPSHHGDDRTSRTRRGRRTAPPPAHAHRGVLEWWALVVLAAGLVLLWDAIKAGREYGITASGPWLPPLVVASGWVALAAHLPDPADRGSPAPTTRRSSRRSPTRQRLRHARYVHHVRYLRHVRGIGGRRDRGDRRRGA